MITCLINGVGLLILATIEQVFQDLFHPAQSGALSDKLGRGLFPLLRRWPRTLPVAGSLTLLAVPFG